MNVRRGDTVEIIAGNHKGQRGEVQRLVRGRFKYGRRKGQHDADHDRLGVAGINIIKKHQRRTNRVATQTGIIEREAPLHHSNMMLVCPSCDAATRVKITRDAGKKTRICKKCDSQI